VTSTNLPVVAAKVNDRCWSRQPLQSQATNDGNQPKAVPP